MSIVSLAIQYFIDPVKGKPVANGFVYVGTIDLDPEIAANQKEVRLRQENGVEVVTSQPVTLGPGGVALYNGSPVQLIVDGDYALKVLDRNGAQVYYVPSGASMTTLGSFQNTTEVQTAIEGQTVFNLTTIDYSVGGNDLEVYINGTLQFLDSGAYVETDSTTVTLSEGIAAGSEVLFSSNTLSGSLSELEGSPIPATGKAVLWSLESTTVALTDITSDINTISKYFGKVVPNTTSGRLVYASGSAAADTWLFMDGTLAHTPV